MLGIVVGLVLSTGALGVVLTVNSTADDLTAGDGQCTLREAIINANTDSDSTGGDCPGGSGADEIVLPAGNYVRQSAGSLDITSDLNLVGDGADATIIDAAQIDQFVLMIFAGPIEPVNVRIEGVKITGACCVRSFFGAYGVFNLGEVLTLVNSSVSDNFGLGIFSSGGGAHAHQHDRLRQR
jgi:CSLREA domain-containing protein